MFWTFLFGGVIFFLGRSLIVFGRRIHFRLLYVYMYVCLYVCLYVCTGVLASVHVHLCVLVWLYIVCLSVLWCMLDSGVGCLPDYLWCPVPVSVCLCLFGMPARCMFDFYTVYTLWTLLPCVVCAFWHTSRFYMRDESKFVTWLARN